MSLLLWRLYKGMSLTKKPLERLHVQCLKFATDQQADLKKVEKLNNLFFSLTVLGPDATGALVGRLLYCRSHVRVFVVMKFHASLLQRRSRRGRGLQKQGRRRSRAGRQSDEADAVCRVSITVVMIACRLAVGCPV